MRPAPRRLSTPAEPTADRAAMLRACLLAATVLGVPPALGPAAAEACPFCAAPSLTLSQQIDQADAAVLAVWKSAEEATSESVARTVFEVVTQLKGRADGEIRVPVYRAGEPGALFLVLATDENKPDDESDESDEDASDETSTDLAIVKYRWSGPVEISEAAAEYVRGLPAADASKQERLGYFLQFLEHDDETVSLDAYSEFAGASYDDVVPLAREMDPAKLRRWISEGEVTPTRLGLYGMMLGLAGDESDAEAMREIITAETDDFRLGIDGIMGGYVLLAGEEGLQTIEQTKLLETAVPFSETYAAMQALRFLWQYAEVLPKDRLKQSMRLLLERPELADLVIADLARWKDWSLIDSLDEYYDKPGYEVPAIRRAIIRFYLAATKTKNDPPSEEAQQVAEKKLETFEQNDPKTFASAKRFFFVE